MFHCWFHTGYIENNYLCFQKSVLDSACKDKKNSNFRPGFKMEIFLHEVRPALCMGHAQTRAMHATCPRCLRITRWHGVQVKGSADEFDNAVEVDNEEDPGDPDSDDEEESKA